MTSKCQVISFSGSVREFKKFLIQIAILGIWKEAENERISKGGRKNAGNVVPFKKSV